MKNFCASKVLLAFFLLSTSVLATSCGQGELLFGRKCVPITYIEGCAQYRHDNSCASCDYGYDLKSGYCRLNTTSNQDCCGAYDSHGTCTQCSSGLYFADPYCVRTTIWGCIAQQGGQCQVCGQGCFISQGRCFALIPNCDKYQPSGVCEKCKAGYKPEAGYCVEWPEIAYCKAQNAYGCVKCQQGYYLTRHLNCKPYAPGCLQYWQS